jgi:hypothetical protein
MDPNSDLATILATLLIFWELLREQYLSYQSFWDLKLPLEVHSVSEVKVFVICRFAAVMYGNNIYPFYNFFESWVFIMFATES